MVANDLALEYRKITAEEQQQEFCSYLGFQSETIIWDEYDPETDPDSQSLLLKKINLIFGDEVDDAIVGGENSAATTPDSETSSSTGENSSTDAESKAARKRAARNERFKKMKEKLADAIWNQKKYNKDTLLMSPIFVALVTDYEQYQKDLSWCKYSLEYSLHPVFRIIKCRKNGESHGCCMIFVDEHARVYQNWEEFKMNNDYTPGYIVAPSLGVYNTNGDIDSDNFNRVQLEVFPSSCVTTASKLAATADTVSTVGGLAATGITIASVAAVPMLPIVATGALITGLGCAAYSVGRSTFKLVDRSKHEQTINVTDNEARSHWFGLVAGAVGLGAGAASKGLASAASRGSNISKVVTGSVNMLNGAAILMNGVGTLNGVYAIFLKKKDGENISMLEIVQLSSSLFIFTHSVYNFQTAKNIVKSAQKSTIGEYRRGLSRNQQKAFDKLVKETIRQKGVDAGHVDVIRSLRNIKEPKQFFGDAYKVNKELNKNNIRMSLNGDGEILLNDGVATTPTELRNNLKQQSSENVFANLPTIPDSHPAAGKISFNEMRSVAPSVAKEHVILVVKGLFQLGTFIKDKEDLESKLIDFGERVTLFVFDSFVEFLKSYFAENGQRIGGYLNVAVPFEDVLSVALRIIWKLCDDNGVDLESYMERIDWNFLRLKINEFYENLRDRQRRRGAPTERCKICSGSYYV
ncbi:hypothetical protein HA402_011572 [Bradysia odoriphaga]|nr:hypothetical protein HA402_011572 [Bradysia odoriphaga]